MLDSLVLVIDDNPETLDLLALCLENEGLRVRKAKNVLRAAEQLWRLAAVALSGLPISSSKFAASTVPAQVRKSLAVMSRPVIERR